MRTTVAIADPLLQSAKERAAAQGLTLGQFIEDSIRLRLAAADEAVKPRDVKLPSVPGRPRAGVDMLSNRAVFDFLDEEPNP
ncbi:MAG: hypothetical protein LBE08_05685 [Bifidobacteriaceae bacterium]|jgi:hypothetical protein|nr:hypothetical protein [Bifidobacteriaceae bacterium]